MKKTTIIQLFMLMVLASCTNTKSQEYQEKLLAHEQNLYVSSGVKFKVSLIKYNQMKIEVVNEKKLPLLFMLYEKAMATSDAMSFSTFSSQQHDTLYIKGVLNGKMIHVYELGKEHEKLIKFQRIDAEVTGVIP